MFFPEGLKLVSDILGDHYASLALRPFYLGNCSGESLGGEDFVRGGIDHVIPLHLHIVGLTALAGPVLVLEGLGNEMPGADKTGGLLVAYAYEEEAVAFVGLFVLDHAPVEIVGAAVPVVFVVTQDVTAFVEVELVEEAVQLVAGEEGVPIEKESVHIDAVLGYL